MRKGRRKFLNDGAKAATTAAAAAGPWVASLCDHAAEEVSDEKGTQKILKGAAATTAAAAADRGWRAMRMLPCRGAA